MEIPHKRLQKVSRDVRQLLTTSQVTARRMACCLGSIKSLMFAVPHIRLLVDQLQEVLHVCLHKGGWECKAVILEVAKAQLRQCLQNLGDWKGHAFRCIHLEMPLFTDASDTGWGYVSLDGRSYGFFAGNQRGWHINRKELQAACFAIQTKPQRFLGSIFGPTAPQFIGIFATGVAE